LVVLMCGLVLLYLIDGLLPRIIPGVKAIPQSPSALENAGSEAQGAGPALLHRALTVTSLLLFMIGVLYLLPVWTTQGKVRAQVNATFAEVVSGWESEALPRGLMEHARVSFRETHLMRYSKPKDGPSPQAALLPSPDAPVEVFVGIGEHLDRFRTPFSPKTAFPGRGWVIENAGQIHLEGTTQEITWRLLKSGTKRAISYHWMEQGRGLFEESVRSFLALDRSPFARELPVMVVRISTEIDELTPARIKQAHDRLAEFHGFVATALDVMRDRLAASESRETVSRLDYPLWERFFPITGSSSVRNTSKIKYLRRLWGVA
jgi:hypothetical protein